MYTYRLRRGLDIRIINRFRTITHCSREPAKSLGQRGHRILLEVVDPGDPTAVLLLLLPLSIRRIRSGHRHPASEPAVLPALGRGQVIRPRIIFLAQFREIRLVLLLLRTIHAVAAGPPRRRLRSRIGRQVVITLALSLSLTLTLRRTRPRGIHLIPLLPRNVLPPLNLGAQPCFPLIPDLALIPFFNGRLFKRAALGDTLGVGVEKVLPRLVPAVFHALDFVDFEGVHGYAADEGDVHAEAAVDAGAVEADEGAEFGGGLFVFARSKHKPADQMRI